MKHSVKFSIVGSGKSCPLRCRVSYNGQRVEIRPRISVSSSQWKDGRMTGNGASIVNKRLATLEKDVDELFARLEILEHRLPTSDELKALVSGKNKDNNNAQSMLEEFMRVEGSRCGWTDSTFKKFRTLKRHVGDYSPGVDVNDITDEWLDGFARWLTRSKGHRNTTIMKTMKLFRWFLRWGFDSGYYKGASFNTYKPRLKKVDNEIVFLELDELAALELVELPQRLDYVRDFFVFMCFTGLRFSDAAALRPDDVHHSAIHITTKKTADPLKIELNAHSKRIVDKYSGTCWNGGRLLPTISNCKFNQYIKECARMAGLERPVRNVYYIGNVKHEKVVPLWRAVSAHAGRRTFVTMAITLGVQPETIMMWTGHKGFDAMKPYLKIVDRKKAEEMEKLNVQTPQPKTQP